MYSAYAKEVCCKEAEVRDVKFHRIVDYMHPSVKKAELINMMADALSFIDTDPAADKYTVVLFWMTSGQTSCGNLSCTCVTRLKLA